MGDNSAAGGTDAGPRYPRSGWFSIDMNAFARGRLGGAPHATLSTPGTQVNCQYWGRDQGLAARDNDMLSNAIEYVNTL